MSGRVGWYGPLALESRRLQAVRWLRDREKSPAEVARALGVSHTAVGIWWTQFLAEGERGLRSRDRPGRPPKIDRGDLARLPELLARGAKASGFPNDTWTKSRVAQALERECGVRYSDHHVGRLLRASGMKWKGRPGWAVERFDVVVRPREPAANPEVHDGRPSATASTMAG